MAVRGSHNIAREAKGIVLLLLAHGSFCRRCELRQRFDAECDLRVGTSRSRVAARKHRIIELKRLRTACTTAPRRSGLC